MYTPKSIFLFKAENEYRLRADEDARLKVEEVDRVMPTVRCAYLERWFIACWLCWLVEKIWNFLVVTVVHAAVAEGQFQLEFFRIE